MEGLPVSLDTLDKWEAWVAIGTIGLAAVTGFLALSTRRTAKETQRLALTSEAEVKAVLAQAEAVSAQAEAAQEQVEVSRAAVSAGMRPVLIDSPNDQRQSVAQVQETNGGESLVVRVRARNAGAGIAFIERCRFSWTEGMDLPGQASPAIIAPGELTLVRFTLPRRTEGAPDLSQLETYGTCSIYVDYTDLAGLDWTTRFDLYRSEGREAWYVREVKVGRWGESPQASSGPMSPPS